ncbi:MAG TPA: CBS domain-containing protein [Gemmatimonadota bacterium]|nr:CBS domain-containing protein [Gemmatimonadota bacterium]
MADATTAQPLLIESQIAPPLQATAYSEVLDELAAFAARQPAVKDGERFLRQVSSLGAEDTIAIRGGAFLPHLRSDAVDRVVVALGMTDRPLRVPNEAGEDSRGRLFALVAAPPDAVAAYLETVASLTALFRQEGVVDTILEARDPGAVARLAEVREAPRVQNLSVIDVMEPASQRVYPDMELSEAARIMTRGGYTALPVVNKNDEIVGMISEKDLIRDFLPGYIRLFEGAGEAARTDPSTRRVRDIMSRAVLCLPTEAGLSDAASIIVNKNVDPLPLTSEGKWVGLISRRSLIRKLLQF